MIIIAVEGLDKAGKYSQTEMLVKRLTEAGYKVVKSEFHRYDTPTGDLVRKWLKKEWDVDQATIELIMAADKTAQQQWFRELEEEGTDFLILDRYIGSQQAFGAVSGSLAGYDPEPEKIPDWINSLIQYCRKPDYTILIDITAETSIARKGKHGENDRYEEDLLLLSMTRETFLQIYQEEKTWMKVDGSLSPEDVHKRIWNMLSAKIKGLTGERLVKA